MIVVEEDEVRGEGGILDLYLCLKKHEIGVVLGTTNLLHRISSPRFRIWFAVRLFAEPAELTKIKKKVISLIRYSPKFFLAF